MNTVFKVSIPSDFLFHSFYDTDYCTMMGQICRVSYWLHTRVNGRLDPFMTKSKIAKRDIKHRQDLSERSFAWSTRYGFKRAKWRRLWRMEIQDFLISAIQNITILIKQPKDRLSKSNVQTVERNKYLKRELCGSLIRSCMTVIAGRFNMALGFGWVTST